MGAGAGGMGVGTMGNSTTGYGHHGQGMGAGTTTTAGPHDSNMANKLDPRVDSELCMFLSAHIFEIHKLTNASKLRHHNWSIRNHRRDWHDWHDWPQLQHSKHQHRTS